MRQQTVLLVEDSPRDVRLMQRAFARLGLSHDLRVVRDGQEALSYLYQQEPYAAPGMAPRPALMLLDLNLPCMSGHDVLRQCKRDARLKQIPIIVLTTSVRDEDVHRAYALGANAYMRKSLEFSRFVQVIDHLSRFWLEMVTLPSESSDPCLFGAPGYDSANGNGHGKLAPAAAGMAQDALIIP